LRAAGAERDDHGDFTPPRLEQLAHRRDIEARGVEGESQAHVSRQGERAHLQFRETCGIGMHAAFDRLRRHGERRTGVGVHLA
jgi:hypothetical protein